VLRLPLGEFRSLDGNVPCLSHAREPRLKPSLGSGPICLNRAEATLTASGAL
jgi:hypothetical protein